MLVSLAWCVLLQAVRHLKSKHGSNKGRVTIPPGDSARGDFFSLVCFPRSGFPNQLLCTAAFSWGVGNPLPPPKSRSRPHDATESGMRAAQHPGFGLWIQGPRFPSWSLVGIAGGGKDVCGFCCGVWVREANLWSLMRQTPHAPFESGPPGRHTTNHLVLLPGVKLPPYPP